MAALTEHGKEVLINVPPLWEEAQAHMVQGLSDERFRELLTQLSDIAEVTREA